MMPALLDLLARAHALATRRHAEVIDLAALLGTLGLGKVLGLTTATWLPLTIALGVVIIPAVGLTRIALRWSIVAGATYLFGTTLGWPDHSTAIFAVGWIFGAGVIHTLVAAWSARAHLSQLYTRLVSTNLGDATARALPGSAWISLSVISIALAGDVFPKVGGPLCFGWAVWWLLSFAERSLFRPWFRWLQPVLWAVITAGSARLVGVDFFATLPVATLGLIGVQIFARSRRKGAWLTLALFGGATIASPFTTLHITGGGDATWYALTMADVLTQFRTGEFPIFVGQSIYQFNGAIFPLRIAPLFHHTGMLLDLLTGHHLSFIAVMNLVLFFNSVLTAVVAWVCLTRLMSSSGEALLLALLLVFSPGLVSVLYSADLYMTWMSAPWLCLAVFGTIRSFATIHAAPLLVTVLGLGGLWWAHAPIALWTTLQLVALHAYRLFVARRSAAAWRNTFIAGAVFLGVIAYPVVSVLFVTPEPTGDNREYAVANASLIAHMNAEAFPGVLLPIPANLQSLAVYQLGWSVWLLLIGGTVLLMKRWRGDLALLLGVAWLLNLLLLPIPGLNLFLWQLVPDFVRDPTGNWAMNRLYVIATVFIIFAAALARPVAPVAPLLKRAVLGGILLTWSAAEAAKFVTATHKNLRNIAAQPSPLLPENITLTRYSYLVFPDRPPYFSHGHVDPALEQRLWSEDRTEIVTGNKEFLEALNPAAPPPGVNVLQQGTLKATPTSPEAVNWRLEPVLSLQPHRHYALLVTFADPEILGVLVVEGGSLRRIYQLPAYGEAQAFGAGPAASRVIPIRLTEGEATDLTILFVPQGSPPKHIPNLATYRLLEYDPTSLPIVVQGWVPFNAKVEAPVAGWLETPRLAQPGYQAVVNHQPAAVRRTAAGLVAVQVPAGSSSVILSYAPPPLLRFSYLASGSALLLLLPAILWFRFRRPSMGSAPIARSGP